MGCREHETDHSVFDVHHGERGGETETADGLLTWAALVCLVLLDPALLSDRHCVRKTTQRRAKKRKFGVENGSH